MSSDDLRRDAYIQIFPSQFYTAKLLKSLGLYVIYDVSDFLRSLLSTDNGIMRILIEPNPRASIWSDDKKVRAKYTSKPRQNRELSGTTDASVHLSPPSLAGRARFLLSSLSATPPPLLARVRGGSSNINTRGVRRGVSRPAGKQFIKTQKRVFKNGDGGAGRDAATERHLSYSNGSEWKKLRKKRGIRAGAWRRL